MRTNDRETSGGVGCAGLLAVLFIGLKLGHVITWSWWWVLAPIWAPPAAILSVFALVMLAAGVVALVRRR